MRRFTPLRGGLLVILSCLVIMFGMLLSTGTVSAHTTAAQSSASAMNANVGCGFNGVPECDCTIAGNCGFGSFGCQFGGCFNNCGFGNCGFNNCGFGNCGFNNCNSLEGFVGGDQFSSFGNCGNFFFPRFHRHHRHIFCFRRHHHRVCVFV